MGFEIFDDDGYLVAETQHSELVRPDRRVAPLTVTPGYDAVRFTYGSTDTYLDALCEITSLAEGTRGAVAWSSAEHGESHITWNFDQVEASPYARKLAQAAADLATAEEEEERQERRRAGVRKRRADAHRPRPGRGYPNLRNDTGKHPNKGSYMRAQREQRREYIVATVAEQDEEREATRVRVTLAIACMARNCLQQGDVYLEACTSAEWKQRYPVLGQYEHKWFCRNHLNQIDVGLEASGLPRVRKLYTQKRSTPVRRVLLRTL